MKAFIWDKKYLHSFTNNQMNSLNPNSIYLEYKKYSSNTVKK